MRNFNLILFNAPMGKKGLFMDSSRNLGTADRSLKIC